jgi:hypothetical protein
MATTSQHSDFGQVKRWVRDRPAISPKTQDSLLATAGGTAVVLGSLMPWISFNSAGAEVKPGAKGASVVLGLIIVALGFALRAAPLPGRLVAGIATLCLSSPSGLLYVGFILGGLGGVPCQGTSVNAQWRSGNVPAGGHQICPVMATRRAWLVSSGGSLLSRPVPG